MKKSLAALFLALAVVSCAQEPRPAEKKRLESVTWDLTSHKLAWTIQTGTTNSNGEFNVTNTQKFEISPDEAVMKVETEKRGFTKDEAAALHRLLDTLSRYCAESVVWWDRGEGEPLDKDGKSMKVEEGKPDRPQHRDRPERRKEQPSPNVLRISLPK